MSSDPIRAALERLVEALNDYDPKWDAFPEDALTAARAALAAAPEGEGPPAVTISALLHPAYEPGDGSADGAQMVGMQWWHPVMGCDSLQLVVDNARNILRSRWARPATPPAPLEGEVGELVAALRSTADGLESQAYPQTAALITRAADLLEQLSAATPAVVPVPVSEALIKAECALSDVAEGEPECDDGDPAQWAEQRCAETLAVIRPVMKQHKIRTSEWPPLPAPQGGEVEA